jgi:hypothetical protein
MRTPICIVSARKVKIPAAVATSSSRFAIPPPAEPNRCQEPRLRRTCRSLSEARGRNASSAPEANAQESRVSTIRSHIEWDHVV